MGGGGRGGGGGGGGGHACFHELFLEGEGVGEIATGEESGEASQNSGGEVQCFADFAHGAASAEGDDVGGHGGTFRGVAAVEFLDDGFSACAAGEIEIDIGPTGASFGEESFEEEFSGDGVAGGDTEGVTDGGVCGGASSLHEDVIGGAEVDDVPNDEEVAGEAEAADEVEFVFELGSDFSTEVVVASAGTGEGDGAEERFHGFAGGDGVFGEGVAEVGEGEGEGVGEVDGVRDGFGAVREEAFHLGGRAEMTFGICGEGASGFVEVCVEADAGDEVEEFAFVAGGAGDAAGGEEGEAVCIGDVDAGGVRLFFTALEMALEFDEEVVFSECISEAGDGFMEERGVVGLECVEEGALVIAGECDQAGSGFCEFVPSDARASFWASKMGAREELAEVSVSLLRADQYGQDGAVFKGQFGSGDGTDTVLCTGAV